MPGSDRPNVLKIAQSVPGAWPTIPALMRLMSSQATFEPVSAKTQPVSGHTTCQIPDIENSCSRDSSGKTPPSVGSARFSSPKTRPLPANPRECRRFSHTWKSHRRDRTGWLGRQDSNLGMAESKSICFALYFNDRSEKTAKFRTFAINGLGNDSECAVVPPRTPSTCGMGVQQSPSLGGSPAVAPPRRPAARSHRRVSTSRAPSGSSPWREHA